MLALASVLALVVYLAAPPVPAAHAGAPAGIRGEQFVDAFGQGVFILGVNYEGPPDRAWRMWEDGRFDPRYVRVDLARAQAAGVSVLRIFLQRALADDIRAGRWAKLDTFLDLADQYQLKVILTLADYPERRLDRLLALDVAVATRYRGRPTIFAYDLKNEPHFGDLALADYPAGTAVALQDPAMVPGVGERIPREAIPAYRASDAGRAEIPAGLSDERAYVYANLLSAYRRFLADAQQWASSAGSTTVAYLAAPEAAAWSPLTDALDATLTTWTSLRLGALRAADPNTLATVGHADPILASLPAGSLLDYRTLHRYPAASPAGVRAALALFGDVRAAVPGKPLVLGEFGVSNAEIDEDGSAALETEMVRGVRERGGAGALKWMLNDFPQGFSSRENAFGMFGGTGAPKPVVAAFRALADLTPLTPPGPAHPLDYPLADDHLFTQASGRAPERDGSGSYSVWRRTLLDRVLRWG